MKRKVFVMTVTALVVPVTAQADVELSGTIQAEMGAYQAGKDANFEDTDRVRVSKDNGGSISNGGPNHVALDIEEDLGNGLAGYAHYQFNFSTAANASLDGNEAWLGLKGNSAYIRFGTLIGNYESLRPLVDPFADTAIQARGTAGGMTGAAHNAVAVADDLTIIDGHAYRVASYSSPGTPTDHYGLAHTDPVNNALEVGAQFAGFSISLQGVYDETDVMDGAGLLALQYQTPDESLTVFAAGSFLNFKDTVKAKAEDTVDSVSDAITGDETISEEDNQDDYNWKVGAQYKIAGATIGLQYEEAEIAYMDVDINPEGGKYILGSVDFAVSPDLLVGGWVAGYLSDIKEGNRLVRNTGTGYEFLDEDAVSFAVGFKYLFSNRTLAFGGYRQVDSDNDYRDESAFGVGLRHSF
jgi:predicted porin